MKKLLVYILIVFLVVSCQQTVKKSNIILYYDLYVEGSLIQKSALVVEYAYKQGDSLRMVSIKEDTLEIRFAEKVTSDGIYRSFDSNNFFLTHSFTTNKKVESDLGQQYPMFVNNWVTKIKEKKYLLDNDSLRICLFDETLSYYSANASYFLKDFNVFLIYYDPQKEKYYKLSKVEGLSLKDRKAMLAVANKIPVDTLFLNYGKPPHIEAPPLLSH